MAIKSPELLNHKDLWVTPADVIKHVVEQDVVTSKRLIPSPKWALKLLRKKSRNHGDISESIKSDNQGVLELVGDIEDEFDWFFASTYTDYLYEKALISKKQWKKYRQYLDERAPETKITLGDYKSPENTPDDSQWEMVLSPSVGKISFRVMLAAHMLKDDNRQYFTENELRLSDIKLDFDIKSQSVSLNYWTIYAAKILTPYDRYTKDLSWQWQLGIKEIGLSSSEEDHFVDITGGVGVGYDLHSDVNAYALLNAGVWANLANFEPFLQPEGGVIVKEIWDMKTILRIKYTRPLTLDARTGWALTQGYYANKSTSIFFKLKHVDYAHSKAETKFELSVARYF